MNRLRNIRDPLIAIAAVALLYSFLPLSSALQLGGDEGFNLMTALLISKGYVLYEQIWRDQPPILVLLLGQAFKTCGPDILAARLIAAGFGLLQFGTFFLLVRDRIGRGAAFFALLLLLAAPVILELSVSVMPETPAFGVALLSAWLLFQWRKHRHWSLLLVSGAVMGIAWGIKLSAALIVPAICIEIALSHSTDQPRQRAKWILVNTLGWIAACGAVFGIISLIWARGSIQSSWRSHFVEHAVTGMGRPEDFPMPMGIFLDHTEGIIAAIVGTVLVLQRKRWREFAFPLVMLATVLLVHAVYRPWWSYYYLHLAIPVAWLAGYALGEVVSYVTKILSSSGFNLSSPKTRKAVVLCILGGLVVIRSEKRIEAGVRGLRQRERVGESPVLAKLKDYAKGTHWAYVQSTHEIYPFHARLLMPPELAVVSLKRFWSAQISTPEIVETCRRYRVEQVLLKPEAVTSEWKDFLKSGYVIVHQDREWVLYVAKEVANETGEKRITGQPTADVEKGSRRAE